MAVKGSTKALQRFVFGYDWESVLRNPYRFLGRDILPLDDVTLLALSLSSKHRKASMKKGLHLLVDQMER